MSKEKDEQNTDAPQMDENGGVEMNGVSETPPTPEAPDGEDAESLRKEKKPFRFERPIEELYDADVGGDTEQEAASDGGGLPPDEGEPPADGQPAPEGGELPTQKPHPKKKRHWLNRLLYVTMLVVVSVVLAMGIISVLADRYGIGKADQKVDVTIPKGATVAEIADILKKDGVISNPWSFRLFVRQNKFSGFQAGVYTVNPSQGYEDIVSVLRDPDQNKNLVSVTIPEGLTLQEIADLLNKKGVCSQQDFFNALDAGGFTFPLGSQIPSDSSRYYKYEGYLFPDTYSLLKSSSGKTAVQKMLSNFTAKFTAQMQAKAKQRGLSVDQLLTLASIIQKEAASKSVMADVASTFYNRLNKGVNGKKLLQSDATVLYAKRDLTAALHSSDAALDSHYNTYRYEGLPPGPICNPGMDAINAALNPSTTNYLYFVSDANGKYYFASTYAQHLKNVKKAAKKGTTDATGDLSGSQ